MFPGTLVNCAAIVAGTLLGLLIGRFFTERLRLVTMQALGLSALLIGLNMALAGKQLMIMLGAMVLGGVVGELLDLDARCDRLDQLVRTRFSQADSDLFPAFLNASVIFIVGAMAILGPLKEGLTGDATMLYTKAFLDGVTAIVLASTMGIGVAFSALAVQLYQGSIALLGSALGEVFTPYMVENMSAVGGLLLVAIGFNLLEVAKFRVMNLLPAIFVAALLSLL